MNPTEALAIVGAGLAAGTINSIVGSGSLITFPTLLAFGYPVVLANVTNNVGVIPGSASAVVAYRRELTGQGARVRTLGAASVVGGIGGAVLLLVLPHSVFRQVVPALILVACVLVALQPVLARRLATSRRHAHGGPGLLLTVFGTGIYGGYFGAAQGVILMSLLGSFLDDDLQRLNAVKNCLALLANGASAVVFVLATHIAWGAAGLIALGAVVGGQLGGILGRRLPPGVLRVVIIAVGVTAATALLA
ncbi:MAG: sulfite exporter TauE/SafE family protein [Acidimicrobiales bacterium]